MQTFETIKKMNGASSNCVTNRDVEAVDSSAASAACGRACYGCVIIMYMRTRCTTYTCIGIMRGRLGSTMIDIHAHTLCHVVHRNKEGVLRIYYDDQCSSAGIKRACF